MPPRPAAKKHKFRPKSARLENQGISVAQPSLVDSNNAAILKIWDMTEWQRPNHLTEEGSLMRTILILLLGVCVSHADDVEVARAIVEKAVKAHGGHERLAAIKAQSWKTKGKMTMVGMTVEYEGAYQFSSPDKMRFDIEMKINKESVRLSVATDGTTAWEQMGDMTQVMAKAKQAEFQHNIYMMHLAEVVSLLGKGLKLKPLPETKVGEVSVVGVEVTSEGKRPVQVYFDKKTNLLFKTTSRVMDEFTNKEQTQDTLVSGYRDQDGIKIFDKMTILRDGKEFIVEEMSDVKFFNKVDAKLFAMPGKK